MKKIYYRPNQDDAEMLTSSQWDKLVEVWGIDNKPFNHMEEIEFDSSFDTSLHRVREILATIMCDSSLNERELKLIERIEKGFKESRPVYKGGSRTVEAGILCKLVQDAIDLFNRNVNSEDKVNFYKFPMKEMYRIYGIPCSSIMDEVLADEKKIGTVEKPETFHEVNYHYPVSKSGDQQCTYKQYYIKGTIASKISYEIKFKSSIYNKFGFLGKLYQPIGDDYFQLYVYDYDKRDWSMQTVIDYLVKNSLVTLK